VPIRTIASIMGSPALARRTAKRAIERGYAEHRAGALALTQSGRREAQRLVRRHRLWEEYLVDSAGVRADHVHPLAEILEHIVDDSGAPIEPRIDARTDPHGRPIPDDE